MSAFDETFHLHLRPNNDLIHPAARIHYYTTTPEGKDVLSHTVPLLRDSVKAYLGEVIAPHHSPARMREDTAGAVPRPHSATLGWARIMVHHQGNANLGRAPIFEGAFSANGNIYHIMTKDNYMRHKLDLDADLDEDVDESDENLVIWRESDVMTVAEEHLAKTGKAYPVEGVPQPQSCGHDRLQYNDPSQHPILSRPSGLSWTEQLLRPLINDTIYRRDDAPTGGSTMSSK